MAFFPQLKTPFFHLKREALLFEVSQLWTCRQWDTMTMRSRYSVLRRASVAVLLVVPTLLIVQPMRTIRYVNDK